MDDLSRWGGLVRTYVGRTYSKALDYRKRADAWDELVRRRGASTMPAGTGPVPAPQTDFFGPLLKLAGLGIAAYVGVNLVRTFKGAGSGAAK